MRKLLSVLLVSMALGSAVFAQGDAPVATLVTVLRNDVVVAKLDVPTGSQVRIDSRPGSKIVYNLRSGLATVTGKADLRVMRGAQQLLEMVITDSSFIVEP